MREIGTRKEKELDFVCACACARERERGREAERGTERDPHRKRQRDSLIVQSYQISDRIS